MLRKWGVSRAKNARFGPAGQAAMADIFISYLHEDIEAAEKVSDALGYQGWSVFWVDEFYQVNGSTTSSGSRSKLPIA